MRRLCKRAAFFWLAVMLCVEIALPVMATPVSGVPGGVTDRKQGWLAPIDISEEGVRNALMSEEEFMSTFCVEEEELAVAESEMCETLGICQPQSEIVSANGISVNTIEVSADKATYATLEDAADYIRDKMVKRKEAITVRIAYTKDSQLKELSNILNKVFEYDINGEPSEGDYLFWHVGAYGLLDDINYHSDGTATVYFGFRYYTDWEEEKYVTRKVNAIIDKLNLKSSSLNDYQKVRLIYDDIMNRVTYDTWHYEVDQSYTYMYTTYAALDSGFAVCQAYASLFYRMCEEVGISARVICGNDDESGSPTHGWNIVKIGNEYYNLDATWDDTISDTPQHYFFLKNMSDFIEHQRNARHTGAAFEKAFPTAKVSYPLPDDVAGNVTPALVPVEGLTLKQTKNNEMKISWTKSTGATRYRVYRKMGNGAYCCLGTTTKNYFMDEVNPKTNYTYYVSAIVAQEEMGKSTEKSIKTKTILLKKGKTYTVDGYKYKVLTSTSKTKTVAFKGVSNKKLTKIIIPDKVMIHGMAYKVTEISSSALKGNTKVKTVSIGANVTKIGSKAFYKAKKLANIVVKSKKLKSVGSKALYGISSKAEIRVPSSKYSKYKKLFKGKGQKSTVKIKK